MEPPTASSSTAPKRKFRKMGDASQIADDLGTMGAYSLVKNEIHNITRTGIAAFLADDKLKARLLHPYLSGTAAKPHQDADGEVHKTHNLKLYEDYNICTQLQSAAQSTGTIPLQVDKETALWVNCKLVEKLKVGENDSDGIPKIFLDTASGPLSQAKSKKSGGWYSTTRHP